MLKDRVQSQSKALDEEDEDPPTPVSDENAEYMSLDVAKEKKDDSFTSLRKQANDRLNKSNNKIDVALAVLSESSNENQQRDDADEEKKEKEENAPFSSIEAEFNKLNHKMVDDDLKEIDLKKQKSGNDVILDMFSSDAANPQENEKDTEQNVKSPSIEAEFTALSTEIQKQQSGNDVVLDIFSTEPVEEAKSENDPFAKLEMKPNDLFASAPSEPKREIKLKAPMEQDQNIQAKQHRKKEDVNDPFASLDIAASDIFTAQKNEKKEDDNKHIGAALGIVGGLLSANPEFNSNEKVESNFVDFEKYQNIKESKPVDYSQLTQIEDTDQYKVVSVQETVIIDDGNGNVLEKKKKTEQAVQPVIISAASSSSNDSQKPLVAKDVIKAKVIQHQTVDIDNVMEAKNVIKYEEADDIKEESEDTSSDDDDDAESMGSEIIHETPKRSQVLHQKLDSGIFGKAVDDDEEDESTSSSSDDESISNGTDPNGY